MRRLWVAVITALLVVGATADVAHAYRHRRGYSSGAARGRSMASIRMQVAAFEAIANQAELVAARNKVLVDQANARISGDRVAVATSHEDQKQADKDMVAAEVDMYASKGSDADVVKDKEKYEAARSKLQAEERRVLHSPEYLAELAKTEGEPEHATVTPKIREKFLEEDEAYQHALLMWEIAHKRYGDERFDALTHDEHWLSASEEKRKSLLAESKALNDAKSGGLQRLPAAENMYQAQRVAQQARLYAAMGRSMLGAMGGSMPAPRRPVYVQPASASAGN